MQGVHSCLASAFISAVVELLWISLSCFQQRLQVGSFWFYQPELTAVEVKLVADLVRPSTTCFFNMFIQDTTQERFVLFHRFRRNTVQLNQFMVVMVNEVVIQIKYIGKPTGHTCTEVVAYFTQHSHNTTSHIFTAVVARTFNHGEGARVTYRKTLTRSTCSKQFTASRTIQTGITNDRSILRLEWRTFRWEDRDTTTCHTFTDIVIGIPFKADM